MRTTKALILGLLLTASTALATPLKLRNPNQVETFFGAVSVHTDGNSVIVALSHNAEGTVDTLFHVDARDAAGLPIILRAEAAEVLQWNGHLVVLAPEEGRALHFSIPGFSAKVPLSLDQGRSVTKLDPAGLDARLGEAYRLTILDAAVEIGSRTGKLPVLQVDDEKAQVRWLASSRPPLKRAASPANFDPVYQDPWAGGSASCSTSCSTTCGNGASCNVNCGQQNANNPQVCAHCTCPVSCSCS